MIILFSPLGSLGTLDILHQLSYVMSQGNLPCKDFK